MSLYDDYDVKTTATEKVQGWSSSIKLLQSQLQLKKATVTQPKREQQRKVSLAPVIDLKSKREDDDIYSSFAKTVVNPKQNLNYLLLVLLHIAVNMIGMLSTNTTLCGQTRRKRKEKKRKSRFNDPEESPPPAPAAPQMTQPTIGSGFAGRWAEEDEEEPVAKQPRPIFKRPLNHYGGSVAAKIMARYGFKEGQGLGRMEQGMSSALLVEKTSKRGGRIIHEKEIIQPP
ncbi:hypothetical protein NQ318_003797 [Aromia moschata]|uniref:G-patch domain-containing protein n=1 Tax=Aromia moschata TaxID=1265417 RepID=A0AAV8YI64_9CUCU|nr:hypothetical protein NQ318_003797 [Aromia moschata]